ncbi:excinuclease ABC subunit UvrC [Peptococcaceae bacterium]|nr:excinuclease ABC subunit UvrC [Peptococcaceae bacterium]
MDLQDKINKLPSKTGVYIFFDSNDSVIYVGKAVSLRDRVRSYFTKSNKNPKANIIAKKAVDIDYIVTDTEVEALILECNLIKKHRPRYNVLLKDDKSYPYIKVTLSEDYPRVMSTRKLARDGSRYFGPYTEAGAVRETLKLIKQIFPHRTCSKTQFSSRSRPCLNFHIKRCPAPCVSKISKEEYRKIIEEIILFLEGKQDDIVARLERQMNEAADRLEFEVAAKLRDRLAAVKRIMERQRVVCSEDYDSDVIAFAVQDKKACVMIFFIRKGKLIDRMQYFLDIPAPASESEVVMSFIKQYYHDADFIPAKILLPCEVEEKELIELWLKNRGGLSKVEICMPKEKEELAIMDMALKNARITLECSSQITDDRSYLNQALEELAEHLGVKVPRRIECFDISNLQGTNQVASLVVFCDAKPATDQYRKFKINLDKPDDFKAMREVIYRRFVRGIEEKKLIKTGQLSTKEASFYQMPDLVIVDGGKGQVSAALESMRELGVEVPLFGLAKKHEILYDTYDNEIILPQNSKALYLIKRIRDEAHRFAVSYHRKLRDKNELKSALDEIEGIGPKRKRALLKEFGTVDAIARASIDELLKVKGMNKKAAKTVYEFFNL